MVKSSLGHVSEQLLKVKLEPPAEQRRIPKSVELHLGQSLYRGSNALHSSATGNEPMGAFLPFTFLTVGNAVFVLLHFVLKLGKLPFTGCPLSFQLG